MRKKIEGKMDQRLDALVSFVGENKIVCDVGTDHGWTAIKILEEKNPRKVIASDISPNSLKKLEDKVLTKGYDIELVVTDGIKDLEKYGPQEIIISGMGGFLISKIIERGIDLAKKTEKLILQANNSLHHLRTYLMDRSFEIVDEKIVYDGGIYYDIIVCSYREDRPLPYKNDYSYEYGDLNIKRKDPLLRDKLDKMKVEKIALIEELKDLDTESAKRSLKEKEKELIDIEEVLKCL